MKRFLLIVCLMFLGLRCEAFDIYPYQNQTPKSIDGVVTRQGNNDVITVNKKNTGSVFGTANSVLNNIWGMPNTGSASTQSNYWGNLLNTAVVASSVAGVSTGAAANIRDPYVIPLDGKLYVMVVDKAGNDWSEQDLLGINDPKNDKFKSLRGLESDKDYSKITSAELKKANIRLVQMDENNTLLVNDRAKDYNLKKIDYIDMLHLKTAANAEQTGVFGHFDVYLKNQKAKMVVGFVTFETDNDLKILFK